MAVVVVLCVTDSGSDALAQQQPNGGDSFCSVTVALPPPVGRGAQPGNGGAAGPGAPPGNGAARGAVGVPVAADLPRLVKVKDDIYLIQNVNNVVAEIGTFGGNITAYLTEEGVILFDSKNDRMHDDVVAKVRSVTDKPIKYVVLTHNHQDHSGGAAKMAAMGAVVVISREDRALMARQNAMGYPSQLFSRSEHCARRQGDSPDGVLWAHSRRHCRVLACSPRADCRGSRYDSGHNPADRELRRRWHLDRSAENLRCACGRSPGSNAR